MQQDQKIYNEDPFSIRLIAGNTNQEKIVKEKVIILNVGRMEELTEIGVRF